MNYGMGDTDPMKNVRFYTKSDKENGVKLPDDQVRTYNDHSGSNVQPVCVHVCACRGVGLSVFMSVPVGASACLFMSVPVGASACLCSCLCLSGRRPTSMFLPRCFSEQRVRVYCRKIDEVSLRKAGGRMEAWRGNKRRAEARVRRLLNLLNIA
ncbi:hypothetical protein EYF80_064329 [Liparis tanakae]|uniref:Uncharacterized protein n=1 Tax=Liparis tanakae TaxID=230148 RepID=A0A4Z2E9V6_9TELE|nr:hypothetical protein EYF80_064329 [Liparis tanakae]